MTNYKYYLTLVKKLKRLKAVAKKPSHIDMYQRWINEYRERAINEL